MNVVDRIKARVVVDANGCHLAEVAELKGES